LRIVLTNLFDVRYDTIEIDRIQVNDEVLGRHENSRRLGTNLPTLRLASLAVRSTLSVIRFLQLAVWLGHNSKRS
jgi:hypothetical protein